MNEPQLYMEQAGKLVEDFLPQCCEELLEWSETSVLPDGIIRVIERVVRNVDANYSLSITEDMVKQAALHRVAKGA